MSAMIIIQYQQTENLFEYRAFSPMDAERPLYKFIVDVNYEVGIQPEYDSSGQSRIGTILSYCTLHECVLPPALRGHSVQVFVDGCGEVVEDAGVTPTGILSLNDQSAGTLIEVDHYFLEATPAGENAEPPSDSDDD